MQGIKATKQLCKVCFDTIISHLSNKDTSKWPQNCPNVKVPIFVTWKKSGDLRGCIGTFSPGNISQILPQYALIAGLQDTRFSPIKLSEMKQLSVGVSLLINFEENKKAYDWQVGRHGIVCKFNHKGHKYSATYLPEVASQQKWDKKEALQSIIQKAGFYGKLEEVIEQISITTYQSSKAELSYEEYTEMK